MNTPAHSRAKAEPGTPGCSAPAPARQRPLPRSVAWLIALPILLAGSALPAHAADKSGVTPNTISVPSGPGSIEGLGESFEPSLNKGTARYNISLVVPPGTSGNTPALRLIYEGGGGNGPLGFGWELPLPCVQRQTDKGIPRYIDAPNGTDDDLDGGIDEPDELDGFINEMKEELVPTPNGFYFCENESAFVRYRRVNDHWEGTLPDGTRLEFGLSANGRIADTATGRVFRWLLERRTDTRGNVTAYSYTSFPGDPNRNQKYLQKVTYGPGSPPWDNLHFVECMYQDRPDWFEDCRSGFIVRTGKRLKEIVVGTQGPALPQHLAGDFNADGTPDRLVRKYLLEYLDYAPPASHWSLLHSLQLVGADGVTSLPPARFDYTVCLPPESLNASGKWMGGINEPPTVLDNPLVDLLDLNGDALPDLFRTDANGGPHRAYLNLGTTNGPAGPAIRWSPPQELATADGLAWNINLESAGNIAHLADMDGDGLSDLAYRSVAGDVYYFANDGRLGWGSRRPMTVQDFAPPSPFGNPNARTADIDFDKRIDVIESIDNGAGADYRIWFNRGHQTYSRSTTIPQTSGFNLTLPGVQIADFNGDGVPDIARLRPTSLLVTAGLGHGRFADPMTVPLPDSTLDDAQIAAARLQDVTGDGLVDLVVERAASAQLWYWINLGTYTLSPRHTITGMPAALGLNPAIRWADLNGNGTTDLLYADSASTPRLLTIDLGELMGCVPKPNLLTRIENGIGRVSHIEYAPSTSFAMADRDAGSPWPDPLPFPLSVVSRVVTEDSLGHEYVTVYRYHDGYYDGVEKEFRGFARVEKFDLGDPTAPTLVTRSHFHTGRDFEPMKGRLLRLTAEVENGAVFWDEMTEWTVPPVTLHSGTNGQTVTFVHPTGRTRVLHELGQGTARTLKSEVDYDAYGNQILTADYGVVEEGNLSASNDERVTTTDYALNLDAWIVNKPMRIEIADEHGTVLSRTEYFYDDETFSGANPGQVLVGNLTMKRDWIDASNPTNYVNSTRTRYDNHGNPLLTLDPLAHVPGGSADPQQGHAREHVYDPRFRTYPIQEIIHPGNGRDPLIVKAEYNEGFGTVVVARNFNGHPTTFSHDALGRLIRIVKPGDSPAYPTTEFTYALAQPFGSNGVVNFVETRALDKPPGSLPTARDHYHLSRQFTDGLGRMLMIKREADADPAGNRPRVVVDAATTFNARQRPARTLNPYFTALPGESLDDLLAFEDVTAPAWTGHFHQDGQLVELDLAAAHQTLAAYDATLRPVRTTYQDGSFSHTEYEPLLTRSYDANDTDSLSPHHDTPMLHRSDGLGRLIETVERVRLEDDGTPSAGLQAWSTRFEYDLNDRLTRITDSQNNTKLMTYDALGRLVSMNDPDRGVTTHQYDAASNITETRDARGQRITFTYDGANRMLTEDYHDEMEPYSRGHVFDPSQPVSPSNRPDVAYFHDLPAAAVDFGDGTSGPTRNTKGALSHVWDLSGEEYLSYDERDRMEFGVKRIRDPIHQQLVSWRTSLQYDSLDRVVRLVYPDNDEIHTHYNDRNLLSRIEGSASGTLLDIPDYLPTDQAGRTVSGNGVHTTRQFDARLRLTRSQSDTPATPSAGPLMASHYTYDKSSNVEIIGDERPVTVVPAASPRRNNQSFGYDNLYRINRVGYAFNAPGEPPTDDGHIQYRYDRIGNLLAQTSNIVHEEAGHSLTDLGTLSYGGLSGAHGRIGRTGLDPGPHALSAIAKGSQTRPCNYDANGNLTALDGTTYTWDFKNRLVLVENELLRAEYAYDYQDRRITRKVVALTGPATNSPPSTTIYVDRHFEVRNFDEPVKYVWNGATRVARVNGALSTRARIQRLRLDSGWNLVSLAVTVTNAWSQLRQPVEVVSQSPVVEMAQRWDEATGTYTPVTDAAPLPAGSVLWIKSIAAATVSLNGEIDEPGTLALPANGGLLAAPGFAPQRIDQLLPPGSRVAAFDERTGAWWSSLPADLGDAPRPEMLAPGEAVFVGASDVAEVEVPESALRIRYYHQDHLGSTSVMTDADGHLVEETAYYPFGLPRHKHRPRGVEDAYAFAQKEQDRESGLHYFEARYLHGGTGRFITADPLFAVPSALPADRFQALLMNPQKLNLYAYALNNPLRYADPSGLDEEAVCSEEQYYAENPLAFYQDDPPEAAPAKKGSLPGYLVPAVLDGVASHLEDVAHANSAHGHGAAHAAQETAKHAANHADEVVGAMAKQGAVVLGTAAGVLEFGMGVHGLANAKSGGDVAIYGLQTTAGAATTYGSVATAMGWVGAAAAAKVGLVLGTGLTTYKLTSSLLNWVAPIDGPTGSRSEDVDEEALDEYIRENHPNLYVPRVREGEGGAEGARPY